VKGTRIPVSVLAELVEQGATREELLEDYPSLTAESRNAPLTGLAMTSASGGQRRAIRSVGSFRSHTDR